MSNIFSPLLKEKRVIILSDGGIKTTNISLFSRILKLIFFCWIIFTNICFIFNKKTQKQKDFEISELKKVNTDLNNNINDLGYTISNIKEYLGALNYYDRFNKIDIKKINNFDNSVKDSNFITSEEYQKILPVLNKAERDIASVNNLILTRIDGINNILKEANLDDEVKNIYNREYLKTKDNNNFYVKDSILTKKQELLADKNKIQYLSFLESFINSIPISQPMENYYISSRYGTRVDPFTRATKSHRGLDFAGPYNSYIIAPADGYVAIVGIRGGFGNSISINHGNNITTDYAHLSKPLVKVGQQVKKGEIIGIQGNSGRSTGQHLHYEIKVKKKNINPELFIKIGQRIL